MYESREHKPIPRRHFIRRLINHVIGSMLLITGSLLLGMVGYYFFEGLSWLDSFVNASMLLGGMGPVDLPRTVGGKIFAGFYALYSGLVFLIAAGVIFAPALHRMLHLFHWKEDKL